MIHRPSIRGQVRVVIPIDQGGTRSGWWSRSIRPWRRRSRAPFSAIDWRRL